MFSKACEYGIKAMIYICGQSQAGKHVNLQETASAIDSPIAFTGKILQALASEDIIQSIKGAGGGYMISQGRIADITLLDIVKAIDGDRIYNGCGLGLEKCDSLNPCPVHEQFASIRSDLHKMLRSTGILDLAEAVNSGEAVLKR